MLAVSMDGTLPPLNVVLIHHALTMPVVEIAQEPVVIQIIIAMVREAAKVIQRVALL